MYAQRCDTDRVDDAEALSLRPDTGGRVTLATPVPDLSVVPLEALARSVLREWLVVEPGGYLTIDGHRFRVVGWVDDRAPGLVVRHLCKP